MPAEWEPQSAVQLTWPHEATDWAPILPEITAVYEEMAREIKKREPLIIVDDIPHNDIYLNLLAVSVLGLVINKTHFLILNI